MEALGGASWRLEEGLHGGYWRGFMEAGGGAS